MVRRNSTGTVTFDNGDPQYYDSGDDEGCAYEEDTGRVPFVARACSACNNAFEASHKLAETVVEVSTVAIEFEGREAIIHAERAGVQVSEAVVSALLAYDESLGFVSAKLCNNAIMCMDGMYSALTPTTDKIESILTPYIENIGRALLIVDKELFPEDSVLVIIDDDCKQSSLRAWVLRVLSGIGMLGETIQSAGSLVEKRMHDMSPGALDKSLTNLAKWGDKKVGIRVPKFKEGTKVMFRPIDN